MSRSVRAGLAAKLKSGAHADVCIRFHLERTPEQQQRDGAEGCGSGVRMRYLGEPVPAHQLILTLGSTYLEAVIKKRALEQHTACGSQRSACAGWRVGKWT